MDICGGVLRFGGDLWNFVELCGDFVEIRGDLRPEERWSGTRVDVWGWSGARGDGRGRRKLRGSAYE